MKATILAALCFAGLAGAAPITFTISTSASGNFNGTAFGDNTVTFTQVTDTASLTNCTSSWLCAANVTTNTVTIAGVGSGIVTDFLFFFDDPTNGKIGIFDDTVGSIVLEESNSAFNSYNMQTNLGPIFDTINVSSFSNLSTSGGNLTFTGNSLDATFTATTSSAPEPGSFVLILAGGVFLHAWRSKIVRRGYDLR
jgi:hypothetical protein